MFVRYAHNLLEHGIYGWNAGIKAYGCTSVAYVLSNTFWIKLGALSLFSIPTFLLAHATVYLFLALAVCYRLIAKVVIRQQPYLPYLRFGVMVAILGNGYLWVNVTGMDTMMSLFANVLLIYASFSYLRNPRPIWLIGFALCAYFTYFVRPDNALFTVGYPFLFLWAYQVPRRDVIACMGLISLLLLIDAGVKYQYFGYVFPIPFVVKSSGFFAGYVGIEIWNTWHYLAGMLFWAAPFVWVILMKANRDSLRKLLPFALPLLGTWLLLIDKVQIMGWYGRLFIPSLPFLIGMSLVLLDQSAADFAQPLKQPPKQWLRTGFVWLTLIGVSWGLGNWIFGRKAAQAQKEAEALRVPMHIPDPVEDIESGKIFDHLMYIMDTLDAPRLVIAASEYGALSAFNLERRIVCLAGLHNELAREAKGLNASVIQASLAKEKPDFIWMPHEHYVGLHRTILLESSFRSDYHYYHRYLRYGMAIRKDSPYRELLEQFVAEAYDQAEIVPTPY